MTDRINLAVITAKDMRCPNCIHGDQIVAVIGGVNIDDDSNETRWRLVEPLKIGQTRNCLNWWQRNVSGVPKFIYPREDDACVNPIKFKLKKVSDSDNV